MSFSDVGNATEASGTLADAQRIQAVLFGAPRAGDANFGMQILSYLYEFSDANTLNSLQNTGQALVNRYLPGISLVQFVVELVPASQDPAGRGTNSIVIGVSLGNASEGAGNTFPFAILATATSQSTLVSQLVF
jgi:hypothetical protein